MGYIRLTGYPLLSGWTNFAADDYMYLADHSAADAERKVYLSHVKDFVLEGKIIGGGNPGDIINNNAAQTLSGKTLSSPTINTPTINTPQIDAATLTGTTVLPATTTIGSLSPTELSYLDGVTSSIQTQLNNLANNMIGITGVTLTVGITFSLAAGVTSKKINQAAILAAASISGTFYVIDETSIGLHLYLTQATSYENIGLVSGGANYKFTKQTVNYQGQLDEIEITGLTAEKSYIAVIQFKINPKIGV